MTNALGQEICCGDSIHRPVTRGRTTSAWIVTILCGALIPIQSAWPQVGAVRLGAYNVDPSQVSVSGFEYGGSMAAQLGVAYSSQIMGVGVFAGVPYGCYRFNSPTNCTGYETPDIASAQASMRGWSGREIDLVANIARQRIYVFAGAIDTSFSPTVGIQVAKLYEAFAPATNIRFEASIPVVHAFPINFKFNHPRSTNQTCLTSTLANCNFDGAGASLEWIYGPLNAPNIGLATGSLIEVDQREFIAKDFGMDELAWLYIPEGCSRGNVCRLHVFLHGCGTSYFDLGDPRYANYSGHRRWADTNDIMLLFPQMLPDEKIGRTSCWDYDTVYDSEYDRKGGHQIEAIMKMVTRITSGFVSSIPVIEYRHAEWDHYFITANQDEVAKLDAGTFSGWSRTGQTFSVYPSNTSATAEVCRFFSTSFAPRSSHFYAATAAECAQVMQNPDWQFEGRVFAVALPDGTGACGPGTRPVYRLYNDGHGGAPNHRYTTEVSIRATMIGQGWIPEGLGPLGVAACVPS